MSTPEEVNEALAAFRGGNADLCHYVISHGRLAISFSKPNKTESAYLVLLCCNHINAPTGWIVKAPHVVKKPDSKFLAFIDENVSIEFLKCWLKDEYKIS